MLTRCSSLLFFLAYSLSFQPLMAADNTAPILQGLTIAPSILEVSGSSNSVLVTATFSEESGVNWAQGKTGVSVKNTINNISSTTFTELDANQGRAEIDINALSPSGTWTIESLVVEDNIGNQRFYPKSELVALGFSTSFEISNPNGDSVLPELQALSISPSTLELADGSNTVEIVAEFSDASGIQWGTAGPLISIVDTLGVNYSANFVEIALNQGRAVFEINTLSPTGTWNVSILSVKDLADNLRFYQKNEISALGFPTSFEVLNPDGDAEPPKLQSFSVAPSTLQISGSSNTVDVSAEFSDGSGVLWGPGNSLVAFTDKSTSQVLTGTLDEVGVGVGREIITFDALTPSKTWRFVTLTAKDGAGNSAQVSAEDLLLVGKFSAFSVLAPSDTGIDLGLSITKNYVALVPGRSHSLRVSASGVSGITRADVVTLSVGLSGDASIASYSIANNELGTCQIQQSGSSPLLANTLVCDIQFSDDEASIDLVVVPGLNVLSLYGEVISNDGEFDLTNNYLNLSLQADTDLDTIPDLIDEDDDGDGVLDLADAFPIDASESVDTDGDGLGDNADSDDDGDGVDDSNDAFPLDASESVDTDGDGIGDNADSDDDGDGVDDSNDAFPLNANESVDTDGDGTGNNADSDDDGDGVADANDAFSLNANESLDTDSDGIGNNADSDDDGDGIADTEDAFPLDPAKSIAPRLSNISTRGLVRVDDEVMIGGVIITGNSSKTVVIRTRGQSLSSADPNLTGLMQDPFVQLFHGAELIDSNDNWASHDRVGELTEAFRPARPEEAALVATLAPGAYTAIVRGTSNGQGVGIVEIFELQSSDSAKLSNISTRGFVGTGDNVLIGGVIIAGDEDKTVTVRARGPSLVDADPNLKNLLGDPLIQLFNSSGELIDTNDNWNDHSSVSSLRSDLQPTRSLESALTRTLAPGAYTAIVRGVSGSTGIGIVEVFEID
tara:strand:- start:523 stop:3393 length:2871 start_codon:yes stop_codon:yes gene_type:complete